MGRALTDLAGRVALITGGGRGQGRSHALALAAAGADVVITDRCRPMPTIPYGLATTEDLEETARLVRASGRRALTAIVDAADVAAMRALAERAETELGGVDVVCANAGVISFGAAWELTEEQWDEVVTTNLTGVWATCRAAVPGMISRGRGGSVVIIASAAGLRAYPGLAHYTAAKHGVIGLMRALAIELAPHRIRVNAVLPGGVRSPMATNQAMERYMTDFPDASRSLAALLPIDLLEPEDVSQAVTWLASDAARFVTGVTLPIDAGVQLR